MDNRRTEHFISICLDPGREPKFSARVGLEEAFVHLWSDIGNLYEAKGDGHLIAMGYNSKWEKYPRLESSFDSISTMFIDCDNAQEDPQLLEKFKDRMKNYEFWTWETPSSTPTRPKFRAIVPLDKAIEWTPRFTKKAIASIFHEYADEGASWFEEPLAPKFDTIFHHEGNLYPSNSLKWKVIALESEEREKEDERCLAQANHQQWMLRNIASVTSLRNTEGWRNFSSVKKCLEGLQKGERDNSLNAACYAMDKKGYRDKIGDFLDEVVCDESIKRKFRSKYKCQ